MYRSTFENGNDCHELKLARFFHVLGQIALNLLVYTESLGAGVRRGNGKKTLKKQEEADKAKAQKRSSETPTRESIGPDDCDDIEAELDMRAEDEAEKERQLAEIAEEEIVGRGLLGMFAPLLGRVVANEDGSFSSEILRQSSTLALCKFMCVSSRYVNMFVSYTRSLLVVILWLTLIRLLP